MAVMEWSSVQDERPSASTSGGQSGGIVGADAVAVVAAAAVVPVALPGFAVSFLAMAIHDATLVQLRHLEKHHIQGSR